MKKTLYVVLLAAAAALPAYSRDVDWGMLLDAGIAGNYTDADSDGNAHMIPFNFLAEMGGGFYVGRFFMRVFVDIGAAVAGEVKIADQKFSIRDDIEDYSFKVGAELGAKAIIHQFFNLEIPIGWSYNYAEFQKPKSLDLSKTEFSSFEKFCFLSHTLYSGLNFLFEINDYFSLMFFARTGFPISQEFMFVGLKESPGNSPPKNDAKIFEVTAGLIFRVKLFGYSGIISTIF
ncbi:MAG: hypothetical protein LBD20_07090 [Spirochaetaceae bacterium]|nr:hypothetical protein [Spirochaetaceae bacterium]